MLRNLLLYTKQCPCYLTLHIHYNSIIEVSFRCHYKAKLQYYYRSIIMNDIIINYIIANDKGKYLLVIHHIIIVITVNLINNYTIWQLHLCVLNPVVVSLTTTFYHMLITLFTWYAATNVSTYRQLVFIDSNLLYQVLALDPNWIFCNTQYNIIMEEPFSSVNKCCTMTSVMWSRYAYL